MIDRTFLDSITRHSCYYKSAYTPSFIRDLNYLGAEFNETNWQGHWVRGFDILVYVYGGGIAKCLPRLLVECMQTVSGFAEGALSP